LRQSGTSTLAVRWIFLVIGVPSFLPEARLVKRECDPLECNSPSNCPPEIHRNSGPQTVTGLLPIDVCYLIGLIDLPMPKKLISAPADFIAGFACYSRFVLCRLNRFLAPYTPVRCKVCYFSLSQNRGSLHFGGGDLLAPGARFFPFLEWSGVSLLFHL
jgi:hypothetical protein